MPINCSNATFTVGTDPAVISEQKISGASERVRLIVMNQSAAAQIVYLAVDATPAANTGLVLNPGGSMAWEKQAGVPIQQKRVNAVSSAAGAILAVYEEVLQ